jgi:hypothetical protein
MASMDWTLKRKVVGVAAGLAVLAGAGGAYAVTNRSNDRQTFLNDVAKRLKVTPDELTAALKGALSDRLAADVAAGRLTQAEADRIKKETEQHGGVPFGGGRFGGGPGGPGGPGRPGGPPPFAGPPPPGGPPGAPPFGPHPPDGPFMAGLDTAAKYLGLTDAQLRTRLMSGKSLADVAAAQHKDVSGLKSAIEAAVKSRLDKAVADKRLTQAQEDKIVADLHGRLGDIVNRKGPAGPPPGRRLRRGPHW